MAYSPTAQALRRCQATTKAGEACRCWAIWGHPDQLCSTHAGCTAANWDRYAERVKAQLASFRDGAPPEHLERWYALQHAASPPCRCSAYPWPHRPGGGGCQWPDVPGVSLGDPDEQPGDEPPEFVEPDR